ncbi:MAG: hypothetical protein HC866_04810 [Leptolyngbyaceae cyanobacterium RU_5_1]|nr:hypothetical protein [Leptolyngbyaceae cyanobacterium RU_5_1]
MASDSDRPIIIELNLKSDHPALLEGLDRLLQLGLISNNLVRQIGQRQLVCPLPEANVAQVESSRIEATQPTSPERQPATVLTDFLPVEPESRPLSRSASRQAGSADRPPSVASQSLQSFMAEISVVWLLFLGVFLVVVSSGVLAATQWQNFSPVGQYGILFGYTLAFWFAGRWIARQSSLQITSRMLNVATLLIIPVNFWTMDGFRLWSSPLSLIMAAIAAIILSSITLLLLKRDSHSRLMIPTAIALSWLHWGWSWAGVPFIATYIGTMGAAIVLLIRDEGNRRQGTGGARGGRGSRGSERFHSSLQLLRRRYATTPPSSLLHSEHDRDRLRRTTANCQSGARGAGAGESTWLGDRGVWLVAVLVSTTRPNS